MDRILQFLKKVLLWGVLPLTVLIVLFFTGEQFEVGRLSAVAACESSSDRPTCIRSRGYLAEPPFYPDLGRRYLGAFARLIGGDLGASYRVEKPEPTPPAPKAGSVPNKSAAPGLPLPARQ